jgi:hypothetical protein
MKKIFIISLFYLIMISAPVFSMGFGLYGTGGYGKVDMLKLVDNGSDYRVKYSIENSVYGGGFIIETGTESDGYHNRLNLGLEGSTTFAGRFDYKRLMRTKIENVFAFRIAGKEQVRFWIGPLLGFNLLTGLTNTTRNDRWSGDRVKYYLTALASTTSQAFHYYGLYYIFLEQVWKRTFGVFIPIGIAIGININLSSNAAITLEGGFRCGFYQLRNGGFNYEGYANAGFIFGAM